MKRSGIIEKKAAQRIMNPKRPRLLALREAAEYLGLSLWGLRERIWAGDIPFIQFPGGRKIWVDVQDLENFINHNKRRIT